jgi:ceramide glucosyltransferase
MQFRTRECSSCGAGRCESVQPAVSILKPLHGAEPNLDSHLESFFNQHYPEFEVLFCARSADDAGLKIAREVAARHPGIKARFFTSGEPPFANAKVASLETMYQAAGHDILIVSDSDVHVGPEYLREVVAPFRSPGVGAVTCLYRGVVAGRGNSLWAYLEGVGMSIEMPAGVLVARMLEGMQFLLGPTMAVRRRCVEEIGGFRALGHYCSDDFLLGNWIAARGHDVVLSPYVVDHVILNTGLLASVRHQVRWMISTRCSRPKGHLGTLLTFAMPFALLAAATLLWMGHGGLAAGALAWGLLSRILLAGIVGHLVVKERGLPRTMLLHPLRDLMGFGYWLASYSSNRILWRGQEYELLHDGMMRAIAAPQSPRNKKQEPALNL